MRRFRQLLNDSSGSVLILVASIIFFIAAFTILAVDISKLLVTRAQLQNAADAGALSGAEMFLKNPVPDQGTIEARAEDTAKKNRAYNDDPVKPVDLVEQASAKAFMDPDHYGMVACTTRAVVSQYFTALPGPFGQTSMAANTNRRGNVAALAVARAGGLCKVQCLKPWSIPDRWDDFSVAGSKGWSGNGSWDREKFTDVNGDHLYESGEPFVDGSSEWGKGAAGPKDGAFNQEFYHPFLTGYVAWKDLGLELVLKAGDPKGASASSQYYPIDLPIPGDNSATGAERYRWNIANCNPSLLGPGNVVSTENGRMPGPTSQGLKELINKDPGAYWDDGCQCIKSQYGDQSPRIVFIPLHDPRIPMEPGKQTIVISKIAAFFIESIKANGDVIGRFVRVQSPDGEVCPPGQPSGDFVYTLTLIDPSQAR